MLDVFEPLNHSPQHLLHCSSRIVANVSRIARAFAFDKPEVHRDFRVGVEYFEFIIVSWV